MIVLTIKYLFLLSIFLYGLLLLYQLTCEFLYNKTYFCQTFRYCHRPKNKMNFDKC